MAVMELEIFDGDPNIFISFEWHGRCMTPQKFTVKECRKKDTCVRVWERDTSGFILFDGHDDWLNLGNEKTNVNCHCLSDDFEGMVMTSSLAWVNM